VSGGGILLALGLLTPLGAAAAVGVMVNAMGAVHWRNGLWVTTGGVEYPLVVAATAAALAFTGAGAYSLDNALDLQLVGGGWGTAAVVVGFVTGLAMLASRRPAPVEAPSEVRGPTADVTVDA
jgi:putative oxidoreductase